MRAKLLILSAATIFSAMAWYGGEVGALPTGDSNLQGNSVDQAITLIETPISFMASEQLQLAARYFLEPVGDGPECVLPKNASDDQYIEFSNCITSTNCVYWSRQTISDTTYVAVRLVGSECVGPLLLCVLPGDASKRSVQDYEACKRKKACDEWEEFIDEENGNVALICEEGRL